MVAATGECGIFASRPEVSATENEKPADGGLSWCLDLRGIWQPRMDSNHRMPESESGALPLGDGAMKPIVTPPQTRRRGFLITRTWMCGLLRRDPRLLTLRERGGAARLAQVALRGLDFARVAGHEAGLAQLGLQRFVVLDQRAGDAQTDRAGLAGGAAARCGDDHVELVGVLGQLERLAHDHARGLAAE